MTEPSRDARYVLCLDNRDFEFSLVRRKCYAVLPDPDAEAHGMLRVVDEEGEDYLYPADRFVALDLPAAVRARLAS